MFAAKLKQLREAAGYKTQQAFAEAFGVAQSTVANWERGRREPNQETLIRLARFLGTTVDALLDCGEETQRIIPASIEQQKKRAELAQNIKNVFHQIDELLVSEKGTIRFENNSPQEAKDDMIEVWLPADKLQESVRRDFDKLSADPNFQAFIIAAINEKWGVGKDATSPCEQINGEPAPCSAEDGFGKADPR